MMWPWEIPKLFRTHETPVRPGEAPDFDRLESYFQVLSHAARLELLYQLRFPRSLPDIRVTARQVRHGQSADRAMSRQAVEEHLQRLIDLGLVNPQETEDSRTKRAYVVNGQRLYQVLEEFRAIGTIAATAPPAEGVTAELGIARPPPRLVGPQLVIVHGLHEARTFPLRTDKQDANRGWLVGRKPGLAVSLDYDPFVSSENSEITANGGAHVIRDIAGSRNGTSVNWRRLEPNERAPLESGDVIGVGRSILVFRSH